MSVCGHAKTPASSGPKKQLIGLSHRCRGGYFRSGLMYNGEFDMKKLTEATGGRVINVGNKFDKLREAFDEIAAGTP